MSDQLVRNINESIRSWIIASQKLRKSASLCYGKIRASIAALEPIASKNVISKLQTDAGYIEKNINNNHLPIKN